MIKRHSAGDVIKNKKYSITDKAWIEYEDVKNLIVDPESGKKWYERTQVQRAIRDYNFLACVGLIVFWGIILDIIQLPAF